MNTMERILTIGICILGTMLTRFLPFLLFRKKTPERRSLSFGHTRSAGRNRPSPHFRAASLETKYAALRLCRNSNIYDFTAYCINLFFFQFFQNLIGNQESDNCSKNITDRLRHLHAEQTEKRRQDEKYRNQTDPLP